MPATMYGGNRVFEDWSDDSNAFGRAFGTSWQVYDQRVAPQANHGTGEHRGRCLLLPSPSHRLRHAWY